MAEWKILFDPVFVGRMDARGAGQSAAALRVLGLEQVAFAGPGTEYFAAGGNLEPLGYRLLGLDAFGTSHIKSNRTGFFEKERAI
jgi:hypothetical protein